METLTTGVTSRLTARMRTAASADVATYRLTVHAVPSSIPASTLVCVADVLDEEPVSPPSFIASHVAEEAPIGLFRVHTDGRFEYANEALLSILGFPNLDALLQKTGRDVLADPGERAVSLDVTKTALQIPVTLRRFDGSECAAVLDLKQCPGGQSLVGVVYVKPTPEGRRASLLSTVERVRAVFEESAAPMLAFDTEGVVLLINRALMRSIGREFPSTGELTLSDVVPQADDRRVLFDSRFQPVVNRRMNIGVLDKPSRSALVSCQAIETGHGCIYEGIITLLPELKDADRANAAQHRLLVRETHHRFKNYLQLVSSVAELSATSHAAEATPFVQRFQHRLTMIASLFEVFGVRPGEGVNLREAVTEFGVRVQQVLGLAERGTSLTVDASPLVVSEVQAIDIGILINELLFNAVKHGLASGGGTIAVKVVGLGREVRVEVRDTGVGMPANFDPMSSKTFGTQAVTGIAARWGGYASWLPAHPGTLATVRLVADFVKPEQD
ncbi:MAG: PAS domain-containing protein [Vicinamibacterales bacterium]